MNFYLQLYWGQLIIMSIVFKIIQYNHPSADLDLLSIGWCIPVIWFFITLYHFLTFLKLSDLNIFKLLFKIFSIKKGIKIKDPSWKTFKFWDIVYFDTYEQTNIQWIVFGTYSSYGSNYLKIAYENDTIEKKVSDIRTVKNTNIAFEELELLKEVTALEKERINLQKKELELRKKLPATKNIIQSR